MEAPEKQHLCRLTAPPAPSPPLGSGAGRPGRAGSRGARGSGARGEPGRPGRTHPRGASPVAGRASLPAAEPAGRAGKERPEPSGSLPWDTSCSALGPGRSPHLSGSLPRPPAEVCAGGDIRYPPAGPARAPRPASPRLRAPGPGRPAGGFVGPPHRSSLDDPGPARGTRAGDGRAGGRGRGRRRAARGCRKGRVGAPPATALPSPAPRVAAGAGKGRV